MPSEQETRGNGCFFPVKRELICLVYAQGPFIVDAETGVAAEPDRRRDSAVAGIITSMHVSDANRTLFMLEAGEGVIYRVSGARMS